MDPAQVSHAPLTCSTRARCNCTGVASNNRLACIIPVTLRTSANNSSISVVGNSITSLRSCAACGHVMCQISRTSKSSQSNSCAFLCIVIVLSFDFCLHCKAMPNILALQGTLYWMCFGCKVCQLSGSSCSPSGRIQDSQQSLLERMFDFTKVRIYCNASAM